MRTEAVVTQPVCFRDGLSFGCGFRLELFAHHYIMPTLAQNTARSVGYTFSDLRFRDSRWISEDLGVAFSFVALRVRVLLIIKFIKVS